MALVQIANRYTDYFVSGTSGASSPDYRTHYYIYYDDNQDVANNRTRIKIDYYLKMVGTRTPTQMSSGVYINGSSTNNYISIPQKSYSTGTYYLGSKDWYIYHDSSGNGSFTFRGILYGGGKWTNRYTTGTTTYTLPTIPRYTSITNFYTQNITLTSFSFVVTASDAIDWVQHSLNGGAWTNSGNQVISGLQPGTQYSLRTRVRRTSSGLWTESGTIYATTTDIAKITSVADNIIMGNNITVNYSNPSGSPLSIYILKPDGLVDIAPYRACSGTSYTFILTEAEKNNMYNSIPTTNDTRFRIVIRTEASSHYLDYAERKFILTDANPTFNNFTFADINSVTTALTNSNQAIIKGYSNVRVTVPVGQKATANKGATMSSYQLAIGAKQVTTPYQSSTDANLTINGVDNNVMILYAIDSRGNSTPVQKNPATYIDYLAPVISELKISRENNTSTSTRLIFSGTFLNVNFGKKTNTLKATYRYKKTESTTWINGGNITLSVSGNNFSCNRLIYGDKGASGFTITESFNIEVTVKDLLSQDFKLETLISAKPNLAMHKDGTSINNPYDESLGHGVQLNGENIYYNGMLLFGWSDE